MKNALNEMIAEACTKTGPLVGYPDVIEALLCVGLHLETLAALRTGKWQAIPAVPTDEMLRAVNKHGMGTDEIWAAMLAAAPIKPGEDE